MSTVLRVAEKLHTIVRLRRVAGNATRRVGSTTTRSTGRRVLGTDQVSRQWSAFGIGEALTPVVVEQILNATLSQDSSVGVPLALREATPISWSLPEGAWI